MARRIGLVLALFLGGCGTDIPDHDVSIESDCSGSVEHGRFHFDGFDYHMFSLSRPTNQAVGKHVSGSLQVTSLTLNVSEHELSEYELWYRLGLPAPNGASVNSGDPTIRCSWNVDDTLELLSDARQPCENAPEPCSAKLVVLF